MGHSEMLLAVAGLKPEEIKKRTEKLSSGDWSDFPASEQLAFQFGYNLTKKPSSISTKEAKQLVSTFGPHRAVDVIWYSAWCNYMTRVADAFQLPLEKKNVFARPPQKRDKEKGRQGDKEKKPQA